MAKVKLKTVFRHTAPVIAGYLVLGAGFGLLMKGGGYPTWYAVLMSVFLYAGTLQYAAIGMFTGGASLISVAITTLALNARHLFYGVSMVEQYKSVGWRKPYMAFALTDETYSLVCGSDRGNDYCFFVSLFDHGYWIIGTLIGSLIGSAIPFNAEGMDFVLTALFITVFLEQWMRNRQYFFALTGVVCSLVCLLIFGGDYFLVPSMIAILTVLLWKRRKDGSHDA